MERKAIIKRIADIDSEISRVRSTLKTIEETNFFTFPAIYERLTVESAMRSEYIACRFRHLIYATLNITKPELMKTVSEIHGIKISCDDGIVNVTLPSLLPKKKKSMGSEFILDPLYYALEQYFAVNYIKKFRECIVCFSQVYSEDTPHRRIRDYDNLELKQVLDVIAAYVMEDDCGALCDVYHTTEYAKKDCTEVSVMNRDKFKEWIAKR